MFSFLGYLINIALLLVIISCIAKLYMNHRGKDVQELPIGFAVKEITDWVLENIGKILTVKEEPKLLVIVIGVCVILMGFFKAIFIK
jgi:hypothetical protein